MSEDRPVDVWGDPELTRLTDTIEQHLQKLAANTKVQLVAPDLVDYVALEVAERIVELFEIRWRRDDPGS
jgi:hypothetical protein